MAAKPVMSNDVLRKAFDQADAGPLFDATLTPLSGQGSLSIHYHWLESALYCYKDSPPDRWTIIKQNETQVSLSPTNGIHGLTLFASVRPHRDYFVQVQEPGSGAWITWVRMDEFIGFEPQPLTIAAFKGLNEQYLSVNSNATSRDGVTGYRIQSNNSVLDNSSKWFMGIETLHQPKLQLPLLQDLTDGDIEAVLSGNDLANENDDIRCFRTAIGVPDN